MKRFGILATLCLMLLGLSTQANAQKRQDIPDLKGKFVYGGIFGGGMSGNYLSLSVSPQVGYRIFNPWEVGLRGTYSLQCLFDRQYGNQSSHYIGFAPYTNYQIYKGLFVHVEDEVLYGFARWNHQNSDGIWFNTVFAGGGYRQYTRSNSYVFILVLYNLSWNTLPREQWDTPYSFPIELRVGFCF